MIDNPLAAAALDQAGDGIIVIDRDNVIRLWNQHCTRLFGYPAEQAVGRDIKLIIPEKLRTAHDVAFARAMEQGRLGSDGRARRTKAVHANGESVYVTMTFAVITGPDGAAIGSVAVAREYVREERS